MFGTFLLSLVFFLVFVGILSILMDGFIIRNNSNRAEFIPLDEDNKKSVIIKKDFEDLTIFDDDIL